MTSDTSEFKAILRRIETLETENRLRRRVGLAVTVILIVTGLSVTLVAQKVRPQPGAALRVNYQTGEAWRTFDPNGKRLFVTAFFQGRSHGLYELASQYAACDVAAASIDRLLYHIPFGQLADALDGFYSDPTNRQVSIADALLHVAMQINGDPQSALQRDLELIRRAGAFQAAQQKDNHR